MFSRRLLLFSVAASCLALSCRGASLRMEASTTWATNINRASSAADWENAQRSQAKVSLSEFREWQNGFLARAELSAGAETIHQYAKAGATTLGPAVLLRQKFGLGAMAPVLEFNTGLAARLARHDGDDGWTANAGLRLAKRLTPSWRAALNTDWQQHYASEATFDTRHHRFYATVAWDVTDRWQLSFGKGRLWGDFVANASPGIFARALAGGLTPAIFEYYNKISWKPTDIFGPGWVSYRVTGQVDFWWLELTPALGRNTSLPLRYDSLFSVNKVGVKYRQDLWTVGVLHRF